MRISSTVALSVALSAISTNGLPVFTKDSTQQTLLKLKDFFDPVHFNENVLSLNAGSLRAVETEALQEYVTEEGLRQRAEALFSIAETSVDSYGHPTRVIGSPGHWGTIHYVLNELNKMNGFYNISTQDFDAIDGKINSFSLLIDGVSPKSTEALGLTPPTKDGKPAHGNLVLVANNGCNPDDYPSNVTGSIALIQRGVCPFGTKSQLAGKKGAIGAIVYNNEKGSLHGTLGTPTGDEVASVSISQEEAEKYIELLSQGKILETTLYVDSYVRTITTTNIIAETIIGDHDNVVMLGAHSDSVTAGPGINDDGSGTISLLEVAKFLTDFKVNNAVRFAWWAAEEEGLLGSDHYVSVLSPEENIKIRLFMDYDMMASPNYAYQVYDANNNDNPNGSGELKQLYIDWYVEHGLNYTLIPFDGRSDYDGFIKNSIPGGGIATGAEGVKSADEEAQFGGKAGDWYDPCYHQLCDDLTNPDYEAWVINTKLIAHSVATYANSFKGFPERTLSEFSAENVKTMFKYHGPDHLII